MIDFPATLKSAMWGKLLIFRYFIFFVMLQGHGVSQPLNKMSRRTTEMNSVESKTLVPVTCSQSQLSTRQTA